MGGGRLPFGNTRQFDTFLAACRRGPEPHRFGQPVKLVVLTFPASPVLGESTRWPASFTMEAMAPEFLYKGADALRLWLLDCLYSRKFLSNEHPLHISINKIITKPPMP
jgi:hypothetical protein